MVIRGWVYVITNKAMPNLVKIGFSTKDPVLRALELAGSGSPHPFVVVFDVMVEGPRDVEQAAQKRLAHLKEGKEWFRCSIDDAIKAVRLSSGKIFFENIADGQTHLTPPESTNVFGPCAYYGCQKKGTSSYKGIFYCEFHKKIQRNIRFSSVRFQ